MVHKEGPDTRYTTPVLILVIPLRLRSIAISTLFLLRCMGRTSRFWCSPPLYVSIWLYHRRFRPRVRVSVTVASCGTIAVSPRGFKVHPEEPLRLIGNQYSQQATTAGFQWFRTTGSPSNRPVSVHGPSNSRAAASRTRRSFWQGRVPERLTSSLSHMEEGQFIGRTALPAFSAAGCAFEGQDIRCSPACHTASDFQTSACGGCRRFGCAGARRCCVFKVVH